MKAQPISRTVYQNSSFRLKEYVYNNFLKVWHYHPEVELIIILESTGTRFIGDSIEKFEPGDIVLIGKNLPHLWLNDDVYFEEDSTLQARCHGIHFHKHFAENLKNIPEMESIRNLFRRADRGIKFESNKTESIITQIVEIYESDECTKLIKLFEVLLHLANESEYELLSSAGFVNTFERKKDDKIFRVYEYILNNFTQEVSLEEAADLANMESSSFSRYFKRIHKKTLTRFVNEIRIGHACKLLIEQNYTVSEICYRSGFNNISHFNRQFKSLKGMTPTEYIRMYTMS
ncbi:AraC family transcriptional regulator [Aliifodinibius sp. S!AR15-10]|uniref:AraC family transcriptional regulator n=1 Tax=Aliifodinibius sp. S!AR15-10 TaxID=2950437 RepID=UPI002862DF9B|nr:AraC family transcriptional regulator [Aliifodinibius sp. S!AR15-10]MDR8394594.1 AraC family transcriptional regulator [Aliifodinibius sp. S!AR15-10]